MRTAATILALLLICCAATAQRETENWYFGNGTGLSFKGGTVTSLSGSAMFTREGCTTVSDARGNLLFYSDGQNVYSAEHAFMANGTGLNGHSSSTQSCLAVGWPGKPGLYILFTTDSQEHNYEYGFQYSVVDMARNGGKGEVVSKNTSLFAPSTEKVTAARHANGRDVWIITHELDSDAFLVYLVDTSGVQPVPIRQQVGPKLESIDLGCMKASPQGDRLAVASSWGNSPTGTLSVFRFDRETGTVYDPIELSTAGWYGVEFSLSGRMLYAGFWSRMGVFQYDLDLPASQIAANRHLVSPTNRSTGSFQLALNGRIYVAHEGDRTLSMILKPEQVGMACGYIEDGQTLTAQCALGLPNFFPHALLSTRETTITASTVCLGEPTVMELQTSLATINSVAWTITNADATVDTTISGSPVSIVLPAPGPYTVAVRYTADDGAHHDTTWCTVHELPTLITSRDTTICLGDTILLTVEGTSTIMWEGASGMVDTIGTSLVVSPTSSTTYRVIGSDGRCSRSDSVRVSIHQPVKVDILPTHLQTSTGTLQHTAVRLDGNATLLVPFNVVVTTPVHSAHVAIAPSQKWIVTGSTRDAARNVDTILVTEHAAGEPIVELDILPYLSINAAAITVEVAPKRCGIGDTSTITVTLDHCAGDLRNVIIGEGAEASLTVTPNPASDDCTIHYTTSCIGSHDFLLVNLVGSVVWERSLHRTVNDPIAGTISVPLDMLPAGTYVVILRSEVGSLSRMIVKQ